MKHFFALPSLLRATALLAAASQNTFSVQDDLLAFPQYEVRFEDDWISEDEAQARAAGNGKLDTQSHPSNEALQDSRLEQYQHQRPHGQSGEDDAAEQERFEFEHMVLEGQRWLCRVPIIAPVEEQTGNGNDTLSKAEQEKELARANDRGWELLSAMQGNCVYFISGWWSYSFCYNQGVKQFHQLPPSRGVPVYPPVEDPGIPGYMLGTYDKQEKEDFTGGGKAGKQSEKQTKDKEERDRSALDVSEGTTRRYSKHGELVQRGESRYLVQKLGGGTTCDLTGKERKIEVQFHCNPQTTDRISLIKETSTCAYLMVIQTPRLCNDVAFLPPQRDHPNPIHCSPVLREDEVEEYEQDMKAIRAAEREAKLWEATAEAAAALSGVAREGSKVLVGDIYVGERRLVPEGVEIEKSAIVGGGKEVYVDTVASSDGKLASKEELEKLGLGDPQDVQELKKKLEKMAQGQQWKLDVIDTPRGREYRAIIGDKDDEDDDKKKPKDATTEREYKKSESARQAKKDKRKDPKPPSQEKDEDEDEDEVQKGSEEEYYKDEL